MSEKRGLQGPRTHDTKPSFIQGRSDAFESDERPSVCLDFGITLGDETFVTIAEYMVTVTRPSLGPHV